MHLRASRCVPNAQAVDHHRWVVTQEGREYIQGGTPEARVWDAAGGAGIPLAELKVRQKQSRIREKSPSFLCVCLHSFVAQTKLGADIADVGFKQAMALKAVKLNKGDAPVVVRLVSEREHT